MPERRKLLWHSNAGWVPTGYGQQTGLFAPRLAETYDIACSAFYGLDGSRLNWNGIPVLPGIAGTYGNEVIEGHVRAHFDNDLRGGLVVTLMDVWVLNPALWRNFNVASWVPVDHDPAPPMVRKFLAESGAVPVAMSRFGEEMLREFDPLYCPHAVDTKALVPRDQREARKATGLPRDAFVVGVVAANKGNPSRKSFDEIFRAFAAFRQNHPEALLYVHSEATGRYDGVRLPALADALGIGDAVSYSDQYRLQFNPLPPGVMSYIYSSFDVLLNPAKGEGFGIPVLEAQACGVPVIVSDFSAMREVAKVGWHVETEPEWSVQMSWQTRPKLDDIVASLEHCYRLPNKTREELADDARKHALGYDVDRVLEEHMLPTLEAAWERFEERAPKQLEAVAA